MALINPTIPTIGDFNSTEDPDTRNTLITIRDEFNGNIDNANIKSAAGININKLASGTNGQIIVCNASGVPTYVASSGDVTQDNAGVFTIGNTKVTNAKMAAGAAVANIGTGGITTNEILDATIATADLGANIITSGKSSLLLQNTSASATLATTAATTTNTVTPVAGTYLVLYNGQYITSGATAGQCSFFMTKTGAAFTSVSSGMTAAISGVANSVNAICVGLGVFSGTDVLTMTAQRTNGAAADIGGGTTVIFGLKAT